jgi:hypothetical protein
MARLMEGVGPTVFSINKSSDEGIIKVDSFIYAYLTKGFLSRYIRFQAGQKKKESSLLRRGSDYSTVGCAVYFTHNNSFVCSMVQNVSSMSI